MNCTFHSKIWRHNGAQDIIARYAKLSHVETSVKQQMPWLRRQQAEGMRPVNTANVRIATFPGTETWGDVRVRNVADPSKVQQTVAQNEGQQANERGFPHVPFVGT